MLAFLTAGLTSLTPANAQQHAIDTSKSTVIVRVYKAGVFSALGHNHEIAAGITRGVVDRAGHSVELHIKASSLRVADPNISEKERSEIQQTMLGSKVLDVEHYREIVFRSTVVQPAGASSWRVRGDLTLHGQTRPVTLEIRENGVHYVGSCRFKQSEFGITPVKVAGGAIRVRDEVGVEFDVQLAR